jgi:hypothetical protein
MTGEVGYVDDAFPYRHVAVALSVHCSIAIWNTERCVQASLQIATALLPSQAW